MGVGKDISYVSLSSKLFYWRKTPPTSTRTSNITSGLTRQDGCFWPEALHCHWLCNICHLVGCLYGHWGLLRTIRWSPAHHTGVPACGQEHALPPRIPVSHRLIPVSCGYYRCTSGNLHSRHPVLVHRLCLHPGTLYSGPCLHSSILQTTSVQCLPGTVELVVVVMGLSEKLFGLFAVVPNQFFPNVFS